MSKIKGFMALVLIGVMALVGLNLTMHAGEVTAVVQGDSNFKNRYVGLVSTTPITDINQLNGVTSNVQDQIDAAGTGTLADTKIFIGSAAGVATAQSLSGDITITNAGVATLGADAVESANIVDNAVTDSDLGWLKEVFIINSGATSNSTAANATYNGTLMVQPWQNTADAYIINTTMIANGVATIVLNGAAPSDFQVQVIRTKQ